MSRQLIHEYRAELDRMRAISGSRRESVLRDAFKMLLQRWGRGQDLLLVPEHSLITDKGSRIYVDGALLNSLRIPFGYWEAKDADDRLDREIADKFRKGYPKDNIIFSDDVTAVLIQRGHEADRAPMDDVDVLLRLLTRFFAYERPEVSDFRKSVQRFATDLPAILEALRDMIAQKRAASRDFKRAEEAFLAHARNAINPQVSEEDVQEMLIQHILTEDIFAKVFDNPDFHRQNNVAAALYALADKLFGYGEKQVLLKSLGPYYSGIARTAAVLESHSEKQDFLKGLYENFYKVYNPQAADRLGVVYTPGEIVRFMIRSTDWLCEQHFGKNLIDKDVEILDPATGTGTFIVELLESFRGDHEKLRHKYKEELHANEVAILPYYVANLNIEASYAAITGQFAEYPNLCFVDTLDNVAALAIQKDEHFGDLLGSLSDENMARVKRQNQRKISVIIGNPPYNAWQENYNLSNPNRPYKRVDQRIKQTYVKEGKAQNQSSVYDMYTRFVRWASDRLGDEGIICFIIGRKPISKSAYDGFRKVIAKEFSQVWLMDLGGDVRDNPTLSGTTHNVFGIQTGVTVAILVREKGVSGCTIRYARRPEMEEAEDKLSFLTRTSSVSNIRMDHIIPDKRNDWLEQATGDWEALPALFDKGKGSSGVFAKFSMATQPKLDEWIYSINKKVLAARMEFYIGAYEESVIQGAPDLKKIKWHRELVKKLQKAAKISYQKDKIRRSLWRPYTKRWYYDDPNIVSMNFLQQTFFCNENQAFSLSGPGSGKPFATLAFDEMPNHDLLEKSQVAPRYRYTKSGERVDNITDWAVAQFVDHYSQSSPSVLGEGDRAKRGGGASALKAAPPSVADATATSPSKPGEDLEITKDAIFAYCYAVLHDPVYRETYALNLKREFPRIPFYPDFAQWVAWGEKLLNLHIHYETVDPFALSRVDTPSAKRAEGTAPKAKLKSAAELGVIVIDEDTQLTGIPPEAWDYRLGNRSGIDWVLDQHKEKTPRDPTIRAKFNSYRFADYKESCITLLAKVVTVSLETVAITKAMAALDRTGWA